MDRDFDLAVGMRIREVREQMNLSREKFSEACDISESFLTAVEGGRKGITVKTLYKICNASKMSADFFIYGNSEGVKREIFVELMNSLDEREQGYALQILSAYVMSIREMNQ